MKKVSVIIPVYNGEKYIRETLFSVLNQTFKNIEIIVVDDESSDNTVKVIENILPSNHKLVRKKNGGEASARNEGLKIAQGEYICFLDADDLYTPEKLALQNNFLDENPEFGMVYSKYNYLVEGSNLNKWSNWNFSNSNYGSGDIFLNQFIENKICIITTMVRRECFDTVGLFDETMNYASDSDMWIRMAAHYKIGFIDECMAYYRLHDTNVSLDRETCLIHRISSMNKNYKLFEERVKGNKKIIASIRNLYYRLIKFYLKKMEFKKAYNYLKEYWN